jgi:hypothetical protein
MAPPTSQKPPVNIAYVAGSGTSVVESEIARPANCISEKAVEKLVKLPTWQIAPKASLVFSWQAQLF